MKATGRFLWIAISASFIFFLPYLSSLTNSWNRLEMTWLRSDLGAIAMLLLLSGLILVLAKTVLVRFVPEGASRDRLALLAFFILVSPAVDYLSPLKLGYLSLVEGPVLKTTVEKIIQVEGLLKIVLIAIFGFFTVTRPRRTKAVAWALLAIVSPAVLIFMGHAFTFPAVPTASGNLQPPASAVRSTVSGADPSRIPVFVFLFDEWSYGRTFVNEEPPASLPALRDIVKGAIVFHRAFSPGKTTNESVPRLLGEPGVSDLYRPQNNVFEKAHAAGWTNFIVGCYLPYAFWFDGIVDYGRQVPAYKAPDPDFLDDLFSHAALGGFAALSRWNPAWADSFYAPYAQDNQRKRVPYMRDLAKTVLLASGEASFGYFHFSIPHGPFVASAPSDLSPEAYDRNIVLADQTLGELAATLKERELWEKSLVVITSDHGWREDPSLASARSPEEKEAMLRHVPFIVKPPHQGSRQDVRDPFETKDLKELLALVFASKRPGSRLTFTGGRFRWE